eukprot:2216674-Amphidinium_carterae.1
MCPHGRAASPRKARPNSGRQVGSLVRHCSNPPTHSQITRKPKDNSSWRYGGPAARRHRRRKGNARTGLRAARPNTGVGCPAKGARARKKGGGCM